MVNVKVLYYILIYIIMCRKNILEHLISLIAFTIFFKFNLLDFKYIANTIVGVIIIYLLLLIYNKFNKFNNFKNILYIFNIGQLLFCIYEEFFWRSLILGNVIKLTSNMLEVFISVAIVSIIFVLHHKEITKNQFLEACLFSMLLSYSYLYFKGINVGMHYMRNVFIINDKNEMENKNDRINR